MKVLFVSTLPLVAWFGFVVGYSMGSAGAPVPMTTDAPVQVDAPVMQQGYRCQKQEGCYAGYPEGGKILYAWFSRGSRLEESEGWIINGPGTGGWKKVD